MYTRITLLITILLVVFSLALAQVFSQTGTITVSETISASMAGGTDLSLEPNLPVDKEILISNSGSVPVDVIVAASVSSELGGPVSDLEIQISPLQPVSVPAGSSVTTVLTFIPDNGIPVQTGTVTYSIIRP